MPLPRITCDCYKNHSNEILCPITGSKLVYVGHDHGVMDGNSYYSPEADKTIIFARHPFQRDIFRLVKRQGITEKAIRYFKLLDKHNSWQELKKVPNGDALFPIDTPEDDAEWVAAVQEVIERERKRQEQNKYWDEHPDEDPRIFARTIKMETVEVKPMDVPRGVINYMDFNYESHVKQKTWVGRFIAKSKNAIKAWNLFRRRVREESTCPTCDGSGGSISPGAFSDFDRCPTCGGKGTVKTRRRVKKTH